MDDIEQSLMVLFNRRIRRWFYIVGIDSVAKKTIQETKGEILKQ